MVPADSTPQEGFQNTFSVTSIEAFTARTLLDSGKVLATSNSKCNNALGAAKEAKC